MTAPAALFSSRPSTAYAATAPLNASAAPVSVPQMVLLGSNLHQPQSPSSAHLTDGPLCAYSAKMSVYHQRLEIPASRREPAHFALLGSPSAPDIEFVRIFLDDPVGPMHLCQIQWLHPQYIAWPTVSRRYDAGIDRSLCYLSHPYAPPQVFFSTPGEHVARDLITSRLAIKGALACRRRTRFSTLQHPVKPSWQARKDGLPVDARYWQRMLAPVVIYLEQHDSRGYCTHEGGPCAEGRDSLMGRGLWRVG